jgi:predicted GIY-YIG superfamily endonuclease
MTAYVYELIDPANDIRFYIGMTANPQARFHQHLTGRSISTAGFIEQLGARGVKPKMRILAECSSPQEAHQLERSLILEARRSQAVICNTRRGWVPPRNKPNHGKSWNDHERGRLLALRQSGAHRSVMARELGRSRGSIRGVLRRLGIIEDT